jgi:hypothetical protein
MIALPRIEVAFDKEGNPSILGFNPALLGLNLGGFKLDKASVDMLMAGNVQHIELRMIGNGFAPFINGKPMPQIAWDDESLLQAADLAAVMNVQGVATIKQLLPIVRRLGLALVLRFPRPAGAAEIPLASEQAAKITPAPVSGAPWAIVKGEIWFDEKGQPGLLGVTAEDLAALGVGLPAVLTPEQIQAFKANNLQYLELRGQPDGFHLYMNGKPLPGLVWDGQLMTNAAEVYAQLAPTSPYIELVKLAAPQLPSADIDILLHFPVAAGQELIPVKTH